MLASKNGNNTPKEIPTTPDPKDRDPTKGDFPIKEPNKDREKDPSKYKVA